MSGTVLTLGGVSFQGFEVPEKISFGGDQMLALKKLVGGRRVIDAMGRDDAPLEWSGRFRGETAIGRARALDRLRVAGAAISLTWSEMAYTVVIRRFVPDFERPYEIPYSIVCEVVTDNTAPSVASLSGPSVDDMVSSDMTAAQTLTAKVGDGTLTGLMSSLDTAISTVNSFAKSAQSAIRSFVDPIAAVRGRVGDLITAAETTMTSVATIGGILPNNPVSGLVQSLESQTQAITGVATLYALDALVARVGINIASAGVGGAETIVAGGDLYRLAAQAYGDPMGWTTIAAANRLTDPTISGLQTILVPPSNVDTGGVLKP